LPHPSSPQPRPPSSGHLLHQALTRFYCTSGPDWVHVSPLARDLVHKLLEPNPDVRILPAQALQHPWLARTPGGAGGAPGGGGGGGGSGGGGGGAGAQGEGGAEPPASKRARVRTG